MILDKLPYSDRADVREHINKLFSRKMIGSVIVGTFIGDYAAMVMIDLFGRHVGMQLGIIGSVAVFIYWERIEQRIQQKQNQINPSQAEIEEYREGED